MKVIKTVAFPAELETIVSEEPCLTEVLERLVAPTIAEVEVPLAIVATVLPASFKVIFPAVVSFDIRYTPVIVSGNWVDANIFTAVVPLVVADTE